MPTLPLDPPADALVLENRHTGEILAIRRVMRNGRPVLTLWGKLPPHRKGPPLHIHHQELEAGRVLAGTLSAVVDGRPITLATGESGSFPIGAAHRWWNDGDDWLVLEGETTPAVDLDRYLQAVFEVLNSGPEDRPPLFYMAHAVWRHRQTQTVLFMPRALQMVLLPLIVSIGTLLGRYRGTDWPGCPSRCKGAPTVSEQVA
jgi:mannose-6-phosphate isomerase-like protein (cupin superfamily)